MTRIAKLAKQIEDATVEQEKILAAAETENRDLTEDETKRFDELKASITKSKTAIEREKEVDANKAWANEPANKPIVQQPHNPHGAVAGDVQIPARCRRHGQLRAFRGPKAAENAYVSGLWVAATMYGHRPSHEALSQFGVVPQATLSSNSNSGAAYFVPEQMDMSIIELTEEYGITRRLADVVPMSSDTWSGPRWTVGMQAFWVGHGQAPGQSEPGWDKIEATAKDLATFGKETVQLNEDAIIDLGDKWTMAAAIAFAYAEDNAAFNGDGTSAYGRITGLFPKLALAANAACVHTATGHTTLASLTLTDYLAVIGKYPSYPGASPRWLCHKEVWANSMAPLQLAAGGTTPADIANGGKPTFLGYPVEFVNVAPRAAGVTSGKIGTLFGDMKLSTKFFDRRSRKMEAGRINDDMLLQLITWFAAERIDVVNHTITDPKDAAKAGPMLALQLG